MASTSFRPTLRQALTFWRRSIQARVVASTVVLSAIVVSAVGWFLLQQTQQGLLDHRVDAVLTEVGTAMADANDQLEGANTTNNDANEQRQLLADQFQQRGSSRGFSFIINDDVGSTAEFGQGADYTEGLDTESVPASLRQHFTEVADTAWTFTQIRQAGQPPVPGIVVGSQFQLPADGQLYTAYFLFPLDEEQETLALVTRTLVTAAALLVLLVAGVTWLVTRQVVTPVRMARRVAERLAAGQLQERVRVTGEDDSSSPTSPTSCARR
jgi:two-component system sensor histidine kinase MtrB